MLRPLLIAAFIALTPGVSQSQTIADVVVARDQGDHKTALELLQLLAEQGNTLAQASLGAAYFTGEGIAKDHRKAEMWFRRAAQQGHTVSQTFLELITGESPPPPSRMAQAEKPPVRVAALSQQTQAPPAQQPRPSPTVKHLDEKPAVARLRSAAEKGHAWAQNSLGAHLAHGKDTIQDRVAAYKWFYLAAQQGLPIARRNQARLDRVLKPADIAKAVNQAEDWIARTLASSVDQADDSSAG